MASGATRSFLSDGRSRVYQCVNKTVDKNADDLVCSRVLSQPHPPRRRRNGTAKDQQGDARNASTAGAAGRYVYAGCVGQSSGRISKEPVLPLVGRGVWSAQSRR